MLSFFWWSKVGETVTTGQKFKYQTNSTLQSRTMLKCSFMVSTMIWETWTAKKDFFVFVGFTRFVLMFRKTPVFHFLGELRYSMVASKHVENSFYGCNGWQRRKRFDGFAQVFGKTVFPFSRKSVFPAADRVRLDLSDFVEPKTAHELVVDRMWIQPQRMWESKF